MRSSAMIAGFFAAAASASAVDLDKRSCSTAAPCLTLDAATQVATNFGDLISNYSNSSATAVLAVDYVDYTDSVIELINAGCTGPLTLGQPTFDSRAAFEAGQGSQQNIPFNILNIWYTCETVALRWRTLPSNTSTESVTGLIVLETEYVNATAPQPYLIKTSFSEFNSGAWLVDLGVFVPSCTS